MSAEPSWFPAWAGDDVVIVASGPSAGNFPFQKVKGKTRCIVINSSWKLAPWADMLIASDYKWWQHHYGEVSKKFRGLLVSAERRACEDFGVLRLVCSRVSSRLHLTKRGVVGWGGNSGFVALNMALQTDASRIFLVGYDMHIEAGSHWHGDHVDGLKNPTQNRVTYWRKCLDSAAEYIEKPVINLSHGSALRNFRKAAVEEFFP